jgi:hypothetical protein
MVCWRVVQSDVIALAAIEWWKRGFMLYDTEGSAVVTVALVRPAQCTYIENGLY